MRKLAWLGVFAFLFLLSVGVPPAAQAEYVNGVWQWPQIPQWAVDAYNTGGCGDLGEAIAQNVGDQPIGGHDAYRPDCVIMGYIFYCEDYYDPKTHESGYTAAASAGSHPMPYLDQGIIPSPFGYWQVWYICP